MKKIFSPSRQHGLAPQGAGPARPSAAVSSSATADLGPLARLQRARQLGHDLTRPVQRAINILPGPEIQEPPRRLNAASAFLLVQPHAPGVNAGSLRLALAELDRRNWFGTSLGQLVQTASQRAAELIELEGDSGTFYWDDARRRLVGDVVPQGILVNEFGRWVQFASPTQWSYVKKQLATTAPLTQEENESVTKLLSPGKGETVSPLDKPVQPEELEQLKKVLVEQAELGIAGYNSNRKKTTPVGSGSAYHAVLQLAIQKVRAKYGEQTAEALEWSAQQSIFAERPGDIRLHQADSRWDAISQDEQQVKEEAALAAQYMVDTNPEVQSVLTGIGKAHTTNNPLSVEQAYLTALPFDKEPKLAKILAEYRVRWSPVTIGSDIYLGTPKSVDQFGAWTNLKYLVHEVMHTVAHPNFNRYLAEEVPPGMSNTILEGTVDYFAQQVWKDIVDALKAKTDDPVIATVHGILAKKTSQVSGQLLERLETWRDLPLYKHHVPIIEQVLLSLKGGEDRLKAAFFYGDVHHFFPRYK